MAAEFSEKALPPASRASSHGDSTDEHDSSLKQKSEGQSTDHAATTKLDSHIVKVKDENKDPFAHLPPNEAETLRRQVHIPVVKSGWKTLYRYATRNDYLIIAVSAICSIAAGAALPLMTIVFGNRKYRHLLKSSIGGCQNSWNTWNRIYRCTSDLPFIHGT